MVNKRKTPEEKRIESLNRLVECLEKRNTELDNDCYRLQHDLRVYRVIFKAMVPLGILQWLTFAGLITYILW